MVSRATSPKLEHKYCTFSMSLSSLGSMKTSFLDRKERSAFLVMSIDVKFAEVEAIATCDEQPSLCLVSPSHPWKLRQIQSDGRSRSLENPVFPTMTAQNQMPGLRNQQISFVKLINRLSLNNISLSSFAAKWIGLWLDSSQRHLWIHFESEPSFPYQTFFNHEKKNEIS